MGGGTRGTVREGVKVLIGDIDIVLYSFKFHN